jgi:hypothetical protein
MIQLLAVCLSKSLKDYGLSRLLSNFINDLNDLYENGIEIMYKSTTYKLKVKFCFCVGDTPALNWLGGFKEGVGQANRFCRVCEISSDDKNNHFDETNLVFRNYQKHTERLELVKADESFSVIFGINRESELKKLSNFNVCNMFLFDPMHILLEGICRLELKLLLNEIINNKKLLNLERFNDLVTEFDYFECDKKDKPNRIENKHIKEGKFPYSAGQMLTLFHNLPLIIGELIQNDDKHWNNFINLIQILNLCLSFVYTEHTILSLHVVICDYLKNFRKLYPDVEFTPKMHFLVHFPKQMIEFGPLRHHSRFRFEA